MTKKEFRESISRLREFYGNEEFLTDAAEFAAWYRVFKKKSAVVFSHAVKRIIRKPTNLSATLDLSFLMKQYNQAREEDLKHMETLRQFFAEIQAVYPKELQTKDDEGVYWYVIQERDYDWAYARAVYVHKCVLAYVTRLNNLGRIAKWRTLAQELLYIPAEYNRRISRKELGPEEDDESVRNSRASYYWHLND